MDVSRTHFISKKFIMLFEEYFQLILNKKDMQLELSKLYCLLKLKLCHQYIYINVKSYSYRYIHNNKEINSLIHFMSTHLVLYLSLVNKF